VLPPQPGPPPSNDPPGAIVTLRPSSILPASDGADNRAVLIARGLPPGSVVRADVFDLDGRRVRTLSPARISDGTFTSEWAGTDDAARPVARGFYVVLVRLASADGRLIDAVRRPVAVLR
jgi:hypothetical protein